MKVLPEVRCSHKKKKRSYFILNAQTKERVAIIIACSNCMVHLFETQLKVEK